MEASRKTALRLIALLAAAGLAGWAALQAADRIEARNARAVDRALDAAGHDWAEVAADGLTVRLAGTAPDEAARFRALQVAGTAVNPANLRDRMEVAAPAALPPPPFRLELMRREGAVTVTGLIPGAPADAEALMAELGGRLPEARLADLLSTAPQAPPAGWGAALGPALEAVSALDLARVTLTPEALVVRGRAGDAGSAASLRERLTAALPAGVALEADLGTPPPVAAPFLLRFSRDAAGARLEACVAATEAGRAQILAAAQAAGVAAADCRRALGAPGPEWDGVAAAAIAAAERLEAATVTVADMVVTLVPAADTDPQATARAAGRIEAALPDGYRLQTATPGDGAASAAFTATRSPEGLVQLRGPVGDADTRRRIESFARARFEAEALHLSLAPAPGHGPDWQFRVMAALDAFAELPRGRLRVEPAMVALHGRSGERGIGAALEARLREALGPSAPLAVDVAYVERLDPVAGRPTPEECLDAVAGVQARAKITFAPGETELDIAALRSVRRIADALAACPDTAFEIAGHTDSQGRSVMNVELSHDRAEAVRAALLAEGVAASRLQAVGYGEAQPVADNDTEAGREANRRIEFRLRHPLHGPPLPPEPEAAAATGGLPEEPVDGAR